MPAAKEHARFFEQYYDAAKTSQPDAYFKAALLAKQWEQAIFVELHAAAELALAADAEIAELRNAVQMLLDVLDELAGECDAVGEFQAPIRMARAALEPKP